MGGEKRERTDTWYGTVNFLLEVEVSWIGDGRERMRVFIWLSLL